MEINAIGQKKQQWADLKVTLHIARRDLRRARTLRGEMLYAGREEEALAATEKVAWLDQKIGPLEDHLAAMDRDLGKKKKGGVLRGN